jgi:hypothetical protein
MSKKCNGISVNQDGTIDSGSLSTSSTSEDELGSSVNEFLAACNTVVNLIGKRNSIYKLFWDYVGEGEKQRTFGEISDDCLNSYAAMRKIVSGVSNEKSSKVFTEWFESETVIVGNLKGSKICLSTIYYAGNKPDRKMILQAFLKVVFFSMSSSQEDRREMDRISYLCDLEMPESDYSQIKEKFIEGIGFGFKNVKAELISSIDKIKLPAPSGMTYGKKCQEVQKTKIERWEKGAEILENLSKPT